MDNAKWIDVVVDGSMPLDTLALMSPGKVFDVVGPDGSVTRCWE